MIGRQSPVALLRGGVFVGRVPERLAIPDRSDNQPADREDGEPQGDHHGKPERHSHALKIEGNGQDGSQRRQKADREQESEPSGFPIEVYVAFLRAARGAEKVAIGYSRQAIWAVRHFVTYIEIEI